MDIDFIQIQGGYAVITEGDNTFYTIDETPVVMLIADGTLDNNSFYNSEFVSTRRFSDKRVAESATDFLNCLAEIHSMN